MSSGRAFNLSSLYLASLYNSLVICPHAPEGPIGQLHLAWMAGVADILPLNRT